MSRLKKLSYTTEICSNLVDALAGKIVDDYPAERTRRRRSSESISLTGLCSIESTRVGINFINFGGTG